MATSSIPEHIAYLWNLRGRALDLPACHLDRAATDIHRLPQQPAPIQRAQQQITAKETSR